MNPRRLSPGSIVDIVAPSGPFDPSALVEGVALLGELGLRPRYREDLFSRDRYLAGTDHRRREELQEALESPDSDLIWAARGGYGATRIAGDVPVEHIRAAGKILVGFSDITALHLRWLAAGVPSVHGSMVARLAREPLVVRHRLLQLLHEGHTAPLLAEGLVPGVAEGVLAGGNLAVLSATCGTVLQPELRGHVLFLEDIGERPYRLDRMLTQCREAGLFDGLAGLVLGEFTQCDEPDGSATSRQVLRDFARTLAIPTLAGVPSGHGAVNLPLPLGRRVRVDANQGRLGFDEPLFNNAS